LQNLGYVSAKSRSTYTCSIHRKLKGYGCNHIHYLFTLKGTMRTLRWDIHVVCYKYHKNWSGIAVWTRLIVY